MSGDDGEKKYVDSFYIYIITDITTEFSNKYYDTYNVITNK